MISNCLVGFESDSELGQKQKHEKTEQKTEINSLDKGKLLTKGFVGHLP